MKLEFSGKEVAPCLYAVFVDILGFGLALPILTSLFINPDALMEGMSEAVRYRYLALSFVLYPLFMFFGSSFMGDLSDIIGRKKVLLMCMAGFTLGFILMGVAIEQNALLWLFVGRSLTGLMAASLPTTMAAIADLSTPQNKAVHMSFVTFIQGLGFIFGPFLSGMLSDRTILPFFNYATPFYAGAVLALIAVVWVFAGFKESFQRKTDRKIHFGRVVIVFIDAARHRAMRLLIPAFLLHQIGIALFVQLILIYFQKAFGYSAFWMGMFNSYFGLWMAIGLIVIVPFASKRYRIEWVACICLLLMGISQILTTSSSYQWLIWAFTIPFGMFANPAWAAMLTSFSNAVDAKSQGWAMGICGSIVALSFIITGFSPNFVPALGAMPIIAFGGAGIILASIIMYIYNKRLLKNHKV